MPFLLSGQTRKLSDSSQSCSTTSGPVVSTTSSPTTSAASPWRTPPRSPITSLVIEGQQFPFDGGPPVLAVDIDEVLCRFSEGFCQWMMQDMPREQLPVDV